MKKQREKELRNRSQRWYVTAELAALVETLVGTCKDGGRKGLGVGDKRVIALLALDGWKVDPETWTMVKT